jgi:hypothetical protein
MVHFAGILTRNCSLGESDCELAPAKASWLPASSTELLISAGVNYHGNLSELNPVSALRGDW